MKIKATFIGKARGVPHKIERSFLLNDGRHHAKLTIDYLGGYTLDVPYGITEATARRSAYYKITMASITQQMIDAYNNASSYFTKIASQCVAIESYYLYSKRLQSLQPQTYKKRQCPIPQPNKLDVEKELMEVAERKFYKLFSCNTASKNKYVADNIDSVYKERIRHWEEIVTYYDYVESVIAAKTNKHFYDVFLKEKFDLESLLSGPETYVRQRLNDILLDEQLPIFALPFEFRYEQEDGLVEIAVDMPYDLDIPRQSVQVYASGKLSVKPRSGKEIAKDKQSFLLGLCFFLASKMFGLALNVKKVRVSLIESKAYIGLVWIEFDREVLHQLIVSQIFNPYSSALVFNHCFDIDDAEGVKGIPLTKFNQRVRDIVDRSSKIPQKLNNKKQTNQVEIPISDAKVLAASVNNNHSIVDAINESVGNRQTTVSVTKSQASVLEEIKSSGILSDRSSVDVFNAGDHSKYGPIEYEEYIVTEHIDESNPEYEEQMKAFIKKVVDIEAPVSRDVLNRRICSVMGISRVSSRLNDKLGAILSGMRLRTTCSSKLFFWSDYVRPESYTSYRKDGSRDALDIAPEEVANCITYFINRTGISERNKVLREVANVFGFTRMGSNVQASMDAGVMCGVDRGILSDAGDKLYSII